ncbi:MAG: hypothetical protein KatS3mg102_0741 [Planctomycetota bacterium]|nr:MAG: hypothetical protein KatS3mg102_0741 [Planctomycetota bacterium]
MCSDLSAQAGAHQAASAAAAVPVPPGADAGRPGWLGLPLGVQLVVLFFCFDALKNTIELVRLSRVIEGSLSWAALLDVVAPPVLAVLFDVLLAVQIALRTRAGRFWGIVYLLALTGVGLALLVERPERWVELGPGGRLRELATYGVNLLLAAILYGPSARRTLLA